LPSIIVAEIVASAISKFARGQFRYARFVIMGLVSFILIFYAVTTRHDIGLWKNSETMWSKVIEQQPFSKAYLYRAWYYFDSGNYLKAIEDYSTCISEMIKEQNTEVYNVYAFRGEALIKTGRFAEAVHDFTFAIAAFPHKLYYYQRGTAFEGLGRMPEAKEDFKRAGNAKGQMRWFSAGTPTQ
jgi:tetratricopeptide (TPR) repeat protein